MVGLKLKVGAAAAVILAGAAACTVHKQEAPSLTGPSELGTSIAVSVAPDVIAQDGASQSLVTITARDANGQPRRSLSLRADIAVNGTVVEGTLGTLSARSVVTDANGRATLTYTAPVLPQGVPVPAGTIQIQVTPTESDFGNSMIRTVSLRLVLPPGVGGTPPCTVDPNTKIVATPSAPADHQVVVFDASTAPSGSPIVSYAWQFGDGATGSGRTTQHSYNRPGTYSVTLTVTDAVGTATCNSTTITVIQGQAPTAVFTTSPSSPVPNTDIFFNAVQSRPAPGRTIVNYSWDFGDGTSSSGVQVSHRYANPGSYTVTLVVTDDAGSVGSVTQGISVTLGAPTANFTFSIAGATAAFNSSSSVPATGRTIVSYSWSFGDPASGSNSSSAANPNHTFSASGTYNVTLTVTDDVGKTGTITKTVTIP